MAENRYTNTLIYVFYQERIIERQRAYANFLKKARSKSDVRCANEVSFLNISVNVYTNMI